MINVGITDTDSGRALKIDKEGTIGVVVHPHPPIDEPIAAIPTVIDFSDSSGSTAMNVNGSSTPVEFSIDAINDFDIYIKQISIVISDAGAVLNEFGNINSLSNGVEFRWDSISSGSIIIAGSLRTNFDFVQLAGGNPPFGSGNAAFRGTNVEGNSEGFIPVLDLERTFGLTYGLRLRKNTTDKIVFKIQDNVSGVDRFTATGYGFKL